MNIFKKKYEISRLWLIIIVLIILAVISGILCWKYDVKTICGTIMGSLCAGIIVAIIQLIIAYQDYQAMDKLKTLYLQDIMFDRDHRSLYADIIKNINKDLDVMGVTALRFFEHFADLEADAREEARVLLAALDRGVRVRILLPDKQFLPEDKYADIEKVKHISERIIERGNGKYSFNVRYFDHTPAHSIFRIDDECIIGPVFPEVSSKNTPALRLRNKSKFAIVYLKYFDSEWDKAHE